jgi:type I restriction enzyme S subunit
MSGASRRYKRYPKYKDSGVEWLGKIPETWDAFKLKRILTEPLAYGANEAAELIDRDLPRYIRITDIREDGTLRDDTFRSISRDVAAPYLLKEGDLLFARSGATVGKTIRYDQSWGPAAHAGYLIRARFSEAVSSKYVYYFTQSSLYQDWLRSNFIQATIQNVSAERYSDLVITIPPTMQQSHIVSFLDEKTVNLDALIAKNRRLIELLEENRSAQITRAVTKGLDPNVPMKDSGVKWLGRIPVNWEAKRLWLLTPPGRSIMYGIVLPGPNVDDGVPIVKGGDVAEGRLKLELLNRTTREIESAYVRSRLEGGDLVFAIRGSIGEVAMIPAELTDANLTQDAARIAYTSRTCGSWLMYALKAAPVFAQLDAGAVGATIRGINIRDLKRVVIPVPPIDEQQRIARYLESETALLTSLIQTVRMEIDRMNELRSALISAAVTGKIDVREEVA